VCVCVCGKFKVFEILAFVIHAQKCSVFYCKKTTKTACKHENTTCLPIKNVLYRTSMPW